MFQVLAHIAEPLKYLTTVLDWLKDSGKLVVEVPNLHDGLLRLSAGYQQFFYHEAHAFYYSPQALLAIMKSVGLRGPLIFKQDYGLANHMHWHFTDCPQQTNKDGMKVWGVDSLPTEISKHLSHADYGYRRLLETYSMADNMLFIGQREQTIEVRS